MSQQPHLSTERFTYGDYLTWPEEERWELIDGVAWNMTPAPSTRHQQVVGELFWQIAGYFSGKPCQAFVSPFDVRLPDADEADDQVPTVVQPDIAVVCDPKKLDDRGCRGAPDLVIEVLSPSTALKDQSAKLALYERRGVKEYWMIHPHDETVTVRVLTEEGQFAPARMFQLGGRAAPALFPDCELDLDLVRDRLHRLQQSTGEIS